MKKRENNYLNMYLAVQMIIAKFAAIWAGLVSFEATNTDFDAYVDKIKADLEIQKQFLKGYAAEKKNKKLKMARAAYAICRKVRSYAYAIDDRELIGKLKIFFTLIYTAASGKAVSYSNNVLKAAQVMTDADKTKYGLTDAEITELEALIKSYEDYTAKPRVQIVGRVLATKDINANCKLVNRLLADRMDNDMVNFEESHPDFFGQYKQARRVIDLQRHNAIEGNVTDEAGIDLKKVKVTIIGKDKLTNEEKVKFEEMTDKDGNFTKRVINPEFEYDVTFEKENYEKKTFSDIDLINGEHEILDVQLVKIPTA